MAVSAPAAAVVGDRVDATFHCEGLTTSLAGTPHAADVSDGVIGGSLDLVA